MKRFLSLGVLLIMGGCNLSPELIEPPASLDTVQPELAVRPAWSARLGIGVGRRYEQLVPVVDGDRVYAAGLSGKVIAFSAANGKPVWSTLLEGEVTGGVGEAGSLLLLGGNAQVTALSKGDGALKWEAAVSSEVLSPPVLAGDVALVRTVDGRIYGLGAADGRVLWSREQSVPTLSLRGTGTPVAYQGLAIAGFANGRVAAYDIASGDLRWETPVSEPRGRTDLERMVDVDGQLALGGGVLFAASHQGRLVALTAASGQPLWVREISSHTGTVLGGRALYLSDDDGAVWALSPQNGGTLWKQNALHGRGLSAPALQGNYLVVGDFEGYLHWLSLEDGRLVARARVEDPDYYFPPRGLKPFTGYREDRGVVAAPVVAGDHVYALDKRGVLAAFDVALLASR